MISFCGSLGLIKRKWVAYCGKLASSENRMCTDWDLTALRQRWYQHVVADSHLCPSSWASTVDDANSLTDALLGPHIPLTGARPALFVSFRVGLQRSRLYQNTCTMSHVMCPVTPHITCQTSCIMSQYRIHRNFSELTMITIIVT